MRIAFQPCFAKTISKAIVLAVLMSTSMTNAQTQPSNFWELQGNTTNGSEFLGTINAADLIFKTENNQRMTLKSTGFLGVGTADPEAWQEILYCPPPGIPQTGLIVTREECHPMSGIVAVPDLGLPDYIGGGLTLGPGTGNPSENNNDPNNFNVPFTFLTGHSTNQITPTYNTEAPLFWVRTQFPANSMNNSGPADRYETKMIVMPDGSCGINIAQPRAALDVRGSQVQNRPAAIFGSRALGTGGPTGPSGLLQYYTQMIQMVPNLKFRGYNSISRAGDMGILFSDGKGAEGANQNGALVIAPWSIGNGSNADIGGLRIDAAGNTECHGTFRATKVNVDVQWWPDFVFDSTYQLMPLEEVATFIHTHKHLPGIPPEQEVIEGGLDLGAMQQMQQKKIEELTLYILELKAEIEALKAQQAPINHKE
jgi:hypothetical protein